MIESTLEATNVTMTRTQGSQSSGFGGVLYALQPQEAALGDDGELLSPFTTRVSFVDSVMVSTSSTSGGGVFVDGATVELLQSAISGAYAQQFGGGIYAQACTAMRERSWRRDSRRSRSERSFGNCQPIPPH